MSVGETFARVVRSPRTAIGSAAALDLTVRLGDLRPALGGVADLFAPALSVAGGTLAAGRFGTLTTWLLFAVAFYHLAPRLFPAAGRPTTERRGFRCLFAAAAVALGGYVRTVEPPASALDVLGVLGLFVAVVVASVGYLRFVAEWDLRSPDGEAVALVDAALTGDVVAERRADRSLDGVAGAVADPLWLVAVGAFVLFPVLAAAVLALFLVRTYPLPDLLAVGYLLAAPLVARLDRPVPGIGDVERRVLVGAREATRTLKGATTSLLAGLGLFGAGLFAFLALGFTGRTTDLVRLAVTVRPGVAWVALGGLVCLYASAAHLSWVWLRTFRRLPAFLAAWRGAPDPVAPPVARPPLGVAPGLLAFVAGVGCFLLLGDARVPAVGLGWPLALVPAFAAVVVARRRTPGPTGGEDHRVVAGVVVQYLTFLALSGALPALTDGAPVLPAVVDALASPIYGAVTVAVVGGGYLPDAFEYADAHEDHRRYAGAAWLAGLAGLVVLLGVVPRGAYAGAFAVLAAVLFVGAAAFAVVKRYRL